MSDKRFEEFNQKQVEQSELKDRIYRETVQALQTEERFVNYFKPYNAQTVESYIQHYANQKANWYTMGDSMSEFRQQKENKWRDKAMDLLRAIFLKKLFNLQCRWHAGELDIEGIEASSDFSKWEGNPALATAVEPITRHEYECYFRYQQEQQKLDKELTHEEKQSEYHSQRRDNGTTAIMFYHMAKAGEVDAQSYIPDWFHFYDREFGTAPLMSLPVTRRLLEMDYEEIFMKDIHPTTLTPEQLKNYKYLDRKERKALRENPEKQKAYNEEQKRLSEEIKKTLPQTISVHNRKKMNEIVALIETKEVQKLYRASREWKRREDAEEIDQPVRTLMEADDPPPVNSNEDYRDAIHEAAEEYEQERLLDELSFLFREFEETVSKGQPFVWKTSPTYIADTGHDEFKRRILEARKWKGEPANFDFLKKENLPGHKDQ